MKSDIIDSKADALDIVNKLRVVDFSFTQTKDIRHTGFIAQEVREVYPDMVAYHEESDTWVLANAQLIPVLNRAIQQQQSQIEILEQQITEQEQLVNLLISRIERLEDVKRSTQTPEPNIK